VFYVILQHLHLPGDGHEVSAEGHAVCEAGDMPVVHVGAVEGQHVAELVEQAGPRALDAQHLASELDKP
jgi:hypothetical protein